GAGAMVRVRESAPAGDDGGLGERSGRGDRLRKVKMTAKRNFPILTETQVRKLALAQSFERGKSYYRDGAILDPVRQEMELRAQCQGSDYEPYEVSATLDKSGMAECECDCPYEHGGICKHIVALLLTYIHKPKSFRLIESPQKALAGRSKEE